MKRKARHPLLLAAMTFGFLAAFSPAAWAGNYVVYLYGRSMSGWPSAGLLGVSSDWTHIVPSYDGSARLTEEPGRSTVKDTIATYCGGTDSNGVANQCVLVTYSAGANRLLLAFADLKAEGRYPSGILWTEAAASSAGGTELADSQTRYGIRLLAKIFDVPDRVTGNGDIANDLTTSMATNEYGYLQNQATTPIYHLAGNQDICIRISIFNQTGIWLPHGVKLCGNRPFLGQGGMPGQQGDGAVPVHSAAGYADLGAHYDHNDGSAKYLFRAYEQVPLFDVDHRGIFGPLVWFGSLRVAVGKNASCPNMPNGDPQIPPASIIYDDGDGAFADESSPLDLLKLCGNAVWRNDVNPLYSTCLGPSGCCTNFSTGDAGGCTCGESLCIQSKIARRSYYTGPNCSGYEYSDGNYGQFVSYNGLGMVGLGAGGVTVYSARNWPDGTCRPTVKKVGHGVSLTCPEYYAYPGTLGAGRRVYRPGVTTYGSDPNTVEVGPGGIVVATQNLGGNCY